MKTADAIRHFGSRRRLARAAGVDRKTTRDWGALVPLRVAGRLERITAGKLAFTEQDYLDETQEQIRSVREMGDRSPSYRKQGLL